MIAPRRNMAGQVTSGLPLYGVQGEPSHRIMPSHDLALLVMSLHYLMDMGSRRHDSSAGVTTADPVTP